MKHLKYLFLLLLLFCCSHNLSYEDCLENCITKEEANIEFKKYKRIVLIPNSGCSGCIKEAEYFYTNHTEDSSILFIFTNIAIMKDFKMNLGKDIEERKNVIVDRKNMFYFKEYQESLYPVVIHLKNGEITHISNLDEIMSEDDYNIDISQF